MIRPKFTIASLLLVTTIVALLAVIYHDRVRTNHLEAQLALHKAIRAQTVRVQQRQLELNVASQQLQSHLELNDVYGMHDSGDSAPHRTSGILALDGAPAWKSGMEFNMPLGNRGELSRVRNGQLRLAREKSILTQLEQQLRTNSK